MKLRKSVEDAFLGSRPTFVNNEGFLNNPQHKHVYTHEFVFELRDDDGVYFKQKDEADSEYVWWFNQIPYDHLPKEVQDFLRNDDDLEQ